MNLRKLAGRAVRATLRRFHYTLERIPKGPERAATLEGCLRRQAARTPIATVIDVGASNGSWSEQVMPFYPHADYLLIEAQSAAHGEALKRFKASHRNVDYVLAAAGSREGQINFDSSEPFGGLAAESPFVDHNLVVPVTTIDRQVADRRLKGPFLVKLDTHGYEVPILDGAAATLKDTSLLIIEAYNFTVCPGALRFPELHEWLMAKGFRLLDLFDAAYRPRDSVFFQMDMVFAPESAATFSNAIPFY